VIPVLSGIDRLPVSTSESLLAGLYYFRLARASVGCWLDSVKPLLLFNDKVEVDEEAVFTDAQARARLARSAFDLVLNWDADVESIRARRAAVDQVTGLPLITKDLRNAIVAVVGEEADHAPSVNQVRRRLGSWFRGEIRAAAGPVLPSEPNFEERLRELAMLSAQVSKRLPHQTTLVIEELVAARAVGELEEATNGGAAPLQSEDGQTPST
jgi:hypothetical protein